MSYTSPLHSLIQSWRKEASVGIPGYRELTYKACADELERALSQGFHLHLTLCGDAFEGDNVVDETKACLKRAAYRLGDGIVSEQIRDSNGNTVGYFSLNQEAQS